MNIQSITPEQVTKAYSGKPGCMCGCRGTYYAHTETAHETANPAQVVRILRTIQANEAKAEVAENSEWVAYESRSRNYVVYLG